ncbi:epoxyqueuosine reductase QueH [Cellulosilyticum sp. I15G10I2]|uniref:epoxyqueuosine reductase QueH n=1 Tax=Cellulosilyticum sp. I15G10I2 TaxID=1892843 RepID=UPI00085C2CF7|nr:epoxyqueuosine reductase QueH [Cellulosilyticum sp. I15G10I2]
MNKINYQKILDVTLEQLKMSQRVPTLLLHSCCAPCSSYVIAYLSDYFYITVFYYNPNIDETEEYVKRAKEQKDLIDKMSTKYPVKFIEGAYDTEVYTEMASPLAAEKEGGSRCFLCYQMRLQKTAETAERLKFDYFATTLTISPLKNVNKLNEIGEKLQEVYGIAYLCSDFKKREGYKRSTELSRTYNLYRQDYCGCSYSKQHSKN